MQSQFYDSHIRILLVDDHIVVRDGLAALMQLAGDLSIVAQAADGKAAIEAYRTCRPDVVVLDLAMPNMGGLTALNAIRAEDPKARVVVLSMYDGDEDIYRAMRAGAKAYLFKDAPFQELLRAIHAAYAGDIYLPGPVAARLAQRMSGPELSPREVDVLQLMFEGYTNQQIGTSLFIAEATVKGHVSSILAKLQASDRTQAVAKALRRGIMHPEPL